MNNLLTSAIGIDVVIKDIQTDLYTELVKRWSGQIDGYGRIYKNEDKDGKFYPEYYKGDNQYRDVFYDNKLGGNFFFIDSDSSKTDDELIYTSNVKCVFMLNLSNIFPNDSERSDTKAQRDAIDILRDISYERFLITGISKTAKEVFSGFDIDKLKFPNIHPSHCFSVNIDLYHYITDKCE